MTGCGRARVRGLRLKRRMTVAISTVDNGRFGKGVATVSKTANSGCSLIPASGSTNGFIGVRRHVPIHVSFASLSGRSGDDLTTNVVMVIGTGAGG